MPRQAKQADAYFQQRYGQTLEELFDDSKYQLMHIEMFPHHIIHAECIGGDIDLLLNRRVNVGFFPWRFVDGESSIGRCVAMVEDDEYEALMAQKASMALTKFGDAYDPAHVQSLNQTGRRTLMQAFTAACAQFAVTPLDHGGQCGQGRGLDAAGRSTRAARNSSCCPETLTTGFAPGPAVGVAELWDLADTLPGRQSEPLAEVARDLGIYLVFGAYERGPERGIVYNSAALLGPDGHLLGVYRKTHLFPTERQAAGGWSTPGNDPVVVETPLANIGLSICYDGDFPELYPGRSADGRGGHRPAERLAALLRDLGADEPGARL